MHKTDYAEFPFAQVNRALAGLLVLLLVVLALVGCSDDGAKEGQTKPEQTGAYTVAWQSVDDVDNLTLLLDEASAIEEFSDYTVQVPAFADPGDSKGMQMLNEKLEDYAADCRAWLAENGNETALSVRPLILDTDTAVSIVLFKQMAPNYGTDGEVDTFVYDKLTGYTVDEDLARAQVGSSDDDIAAALVQYIDEEMNDGYKHKWLGFTTDAFYVDTDGQVVLIVETEIATEGSDNWTYPLLFKDGRIVGKLTNMLK